MFDIVNRSQCDCVMKQLYVNLNDDDTEERQHEDNNRNYVTKDQDISAEIWQMLPWSINTQSTD